ncbi:MAG TPA: hypothetical protein VEX68_21590 [Bryobacteraceae bacterium]|nr:hypothetical protein [Bryobacteraceae bacterium]
MPTLKFKTVDGTEIAYVKRRLLPQESEFSTILTHSVTEGERLDTITAKYLDDSQQFWRIADANIAVSPFELVERVGRRVRIALPQGIPGSRNA